MAVDFIYCNDNDDEQVMHLKSDNIQLMTSDKVNEVIKETFESHFLSLFF